MALDLLIKRWGFGWLSAHEFCVDILNHLGCNLIFFNMFLSRLEIPRGIRSSC